MSDFSHQVSQISAKTHQLFSAFRQQKAILERVEFENKQLKIALDTLKSKNEELKNRIENISVKQLFVNEVSTKKAPNTNEAKQKIDKLITEIDKYILLLK